MKVRLLWSPKFAAVLIVAMLALGVVSFLVPQRSHPELTLYTQWAQENPTAARVARSVGADDVFASPVFLGLVALLELNLVACTLHRVRSLRDRVPRVPASAPVSAVRVDLPHVPEHLADLVSGRWSMWKVRSATEGQRRYLVLDRLDRARLGSLVMHVGLMLLILGGAVAALTRFTGSFALTEGQTLPDERSSYLGQPSEPTLGAAYSGALVRLDSLRFDYDQGLVTQVHAKMTFTQGDTTRSVQAAVNEPASFAGKSYLLIKGGHAVGLSVSGPSGQLIPDSIIRLAERTPGGYSDWVALPDGSRLTIRTRANGSSEALAVREPLRLQNPVVLFQVGDTGPTLTLRQGESGSLGGLTVAVSDVRLWNDFSVTGDRSLPLVYLAFGVILVGASVRFGFGRGRLGVLAETTGDGAAAWVWGSDQAQVAKVVDRLSALNESEAAKS